MTRKYLGSPYQPPNRQLDKNNLHDRILLDAAGISVGYVRTYPDELDRDVDEVESNEELSDKGKQRRKQKLSADYEQHKDAKSIGEPWIARAEKEIADLRAVLNRRPQRDGLSVAEQIREEHRFNRMMMDFRQLTSEQRSSKAWEAIGKCATSERARELVQGLADDGLLNAPMEEAARRAVRQGAHPEAVRAHDELVEALEKVKFARDNYHGYVRERTGTGLTAQQLAEQHNVPPPQVDEHRIFLSRATASNAVVFRAAKIEAQQAGLPLEVETLEQAFGRGTEGGGSTNGTGGDGGAGV
jgi:hypothetical protein